jgi:hypothetical protein
VGCPEKLNPDKEYGEKMIMKAKIASKRSHVLLYGAIVVILLMNVSLSGCKSTASGGGMSDEDRKKFSTRVDPNNPPPEAVAAMAKARARSAASATTPVGGTGTVAPK